MVHQLYIQWSNCFINTLQAVAHNAYLMHIQKFARSVLDINNGVPLGSHSTIVFYLSYKLRHLICMFSILCIIYVIPLFTDSGSCMTNKGNGSSNMKQHQQSK